MQRLRTLVAGVATAAIMVACRDPLDVTNVNNPETERVLRTPADIEKFIGDSYLTWWNAAYGVEGLYFQLSAMSFEHSPMAANFGMIERSALPRAQIVNTVSDQFAGESNTFWNNTYAAIKQASDGIDRMDAGIDLGANAQRARAFARFVQGLGHAHLAITFDSAQIVTENNLGQVEPFVPYSEVMEHALTMLDSAIALAEANSFTLPAEWINGNALSSAAFVRLAHSYKARFRAQVARTPEERQAVDWNAVIADVDAGITSDFRITMDDNVWFNINTYYHSFFGAWNQVNTIVLGMADTSGAYQTWMNTPLNERQAFDIATPDTRWPRTATVDDEGSIFAYRGNAGSWVRSDRGTWRWSNYRDERYVDFYDAGYLGAYPVILRAEMDFLEAEGLIRTGQSGPALTIINTYRTSAGLPAATASGVSGGGCVPRLPNGECGNLLEVLKYEKRIAIMGTTYGGWFFDSRGWGDLAQGTALSYPVPAREREVRQQSASNAGGASGNYVAPLGTYGY